MLHHYENKQLSYYGVDQIATFVVFESQEEFDPKKLGLHGFSVSGMTSQGIGLEWNWNYQSMKTCLAMS